MTDRLRILLLVCINESVSRDRMLRRLQNGDGRLPIQSAEQLVETQTLEEAAKHLNGWYAQSECCGAIVLSDLLVQGSEQTNSAKILFDNFGRKLYATIAVMDRPKRILDVDRAIAPDCTQDEFHGVLKLCMDRLDYLMPPQHNESLHTVEIRPLRREYEFLDYFKLRYAVYLPMSYLDPKVELAPSRMEIDWFDKKSVHIGAFERDEYGRETLIGAARLITTRLINQYHSDMAVKAAEQDWVLNDIVTNGANLWMLPVFQSHGEMIDEIMETTVRELVFGELSRVIVGPNHRGTGLSHRLCKFAISTATSVGVDRLFLECLPVHADIYRKVGFETFSELRGKVYGIDRTMIVMHLPLRGEPIIRQPAPGVSDTDRVTRL